MTDKNSVEVAPSSLAIVRRLQCKKLMHFRGKINLENIWTFFHLNGINTMRIAFSCTCQPNIKDVQAHITIDFMN